ncbi:MAG: Thiosulfate sulfurtransferase GlpE [Bacteroidia bacterium]|nr:Thiosulfate sulfurtransferase GlpE [Bacteroidia bacterium]
MIEKIKNLFGVKSVDYSALVKAGAEIIDVRSKGEYAGGHIRGSKNIPVDSLANHISKLNKNKAIITCCASGMRSGVAKTMLKNNGFKEVHNGGSWQSLQNKISKK